VQLANDLTIAVPTRHRLESLQRLFESILETASVIPHLLFLHDAPEDRSSALWASQQQTIKNLEFTSKQSMTALWNNAILRSSTDWVLICNDDVVFRAGWAEYISRATRLVGDKQIQLCGYSAFCVHKSLIPLLGWFDERFTGGYYEDVDWQMRLGESGLEGVVDFSHDNMFVEHRKVAQPGTPEWPWHDNAKWFCEKWGRRDCTNWGAPSFRTAFEIDWYPENTEKYAGLYRVSSRLKEINSTVGFRRPVFPTRDRVNGKEGTWSASESLRQKDRIQ
jgi:hypothetical protein